MITKHRLLWMILLLNGVVSGCSVMSGSHRTQGGPAVVACPNTPRELQKVTLPDYIVEPPDVLSIDVVDLVPRAPYALRPHDIIRVQATGLPTDSPLPTPTGEYEIGIDGTLVLGGGYDMVTSENGTRQYQPLRLAGFPVEVACDLIQRRLATVARDPEVWVTLLQLAPQQDIAGEHLVGPDGTINLGVYGRVRVVGLTIEGVRAAVESHLSANFENPQVAVDVYGYNSKVFYVVTQGAGLGDQVVQFPLTGRETALDAISQIQGLQANQSTRMWVARPGRNECGGDQVMPIDWLGITQRGDPVTNYQLLPGDRVFVAEDKMVAFDTYLAKVISPIERVLGVTLLATQTSKQIKFFNDPNAGRF